MNKNNWNIKQRQKISYMIVSNSNKVLFELQRDSLSSINKVNYKSFLNFELVRVIEKFE